MFRRTATLFALLLILVFGMGLYSQRGAAIAGSGWVAKRVCSGVFVAGRDAGALPEASLPLPIPIPIPAEVDREAGRVTAWFANFLAPSTARFRPGLGCTLEGPGEGPSPLDALAPLEPAPPADPLPRAPTRARVDAAIATAFEDSQGGYGTRAVVVLHRGALAGEAYAEGFSVTTPLPGWSMTKSVTSALVGFLVDAGRIALDAPVGLDEWGDDGDPRRVITWDQLLRMSSGLAFSENYALPSSDAIQMLFGNVRFSKGRYAAMLPLAHAPDTHWSYASGTSNLLQYAMLTKVFGGDLAAYQRFPRQTLFGPIGMASAVFEPDERGVFVGSSHLYATARDWGRFGQLFLDRGTWQGRRLLSERWVRYSGTPTPTNARGTYGAHWWLNADPDEGERRMPALDANLMIASGFEGQYVIVVPDHELVVVRLGLDRGAGIDIEGLVARVVDAVRAEAGSS